MDRVVRMGSHCPHRSSEGIASYSTTDYWMHIKNTSTKQKYQNMQLEHNPIQPSLIKREKMAMEKRKYLETETEEDTSNDNNQQHDVSKKRKFQAVTESMPSESSSSQQSNERKYVAAIEAKAANTYNKHLIGEVLIRYYEIKDTDQKRQKLDQSVAERNIHAIQHEDCKMPARCLAYSKRADRGPMTSTSTSFDPNNRESSTTIFPASSETSCHSHIVPIPEMSKMIKFTALDVLFGRRTGQRNNPGNVRLRELCSSFHEEYKHGSRGQKTALTWRIVHSIQSEGGRFLKFDEATEAWSEVAHHIAREKVAFTIRETPYPMSDVDI